MLLCCVVFPSVAVALLFNEEPFSTTRVQLSMAASILAGLMFIVVKRQMSEIPSLRGTESNLAILIACFGLFATLLLLLRLEYSRVFLFSAFLFCFLGQMSLLAAGGKRQPGHFWVVPYGIVERIQNIAGVEYEKLQAPDVPQYPSRGIAVDLRAELPDEWERMIAQSVLAGIPVYHVKQLEEALTGRVDIEHLSENTLGSLTPDKLSLQIKRIGDALASLLILPLLFPVFLIVAVLVKLDSKGPVFFLQKRIGHRGHNFRMIKFRTMTHHEASDEDVRDHAITQTDDQRITRIGRFLRKYRIDELPQVFNVLKGEMSWIGPRPEALSLAQWYEENLPFYSYRHIVRPGITGWAQVNQGHVADLHAVHEKLRYDFYYIKNFSIWLDFSIIAQTIRVMLSGFGSK